MLLPIVQEALDAQGWKYEVTLDGEACTFHLAGRSTRYRCLVVADDTLEQVGFLVIPPQLIPEPARAAACEYITRVNYGLRLGSFDIDLSDGEWRFRYGIDVEGGVLTSTMVRMMFAIAVGAMDAYHDGMLRVAFGGAEPAQAHADATAARQREWEAMQAADGASAAETATPAGDASASDEEEIDLDAILAELLGDADASAGPSSPAASHAPPVESDDRRHVPASSTGNTVVASTPAAATESEAMPPKDDPEPMLPIPNAYVVPGTRLIAGEYPGSPPSNPTSDLERKLASFLDVGVTAFVDLTGPDDPLAPYEPTLRALAGRRDVAVSHDRLTIADMDVCDEAHMCEVLDTIDAHLAAGRTVYVHCWGGVGRTGTVVGCWLVRHGRTGIEALAEVGRLFATMTPRKVRRHAATGSPQTRAQRAMVKDWGESVMVRRTGAQARTARARRAARAAMPKIDEPSAPPTASSPTGAREQAGLARRIHTGIRGCLLGGALGDALGWPVEFLSLTRIRSHYGPEGIQELDPRADGGLGAFTDDTQMTLFTAEGILRSTTRHMEYWSYSEPDASQWMGAHAPHPDVMRHAYQRWLHTQDAVPAGHGAPYLEEFPGWLVGVRSLHARRAPGNTCLGSLRASFEGSGEGPVANGSKGCGGVMRVAPVGLVPCEDPFAYAVMAARLTHGHPSGHLSAGAYAHMLHDMLYGRLSLPDAVRRAMQRLAGEPGHEETAAALDRAYRLAADPGAPSAERVESLGQGWTGEEALAIGVYCALVADDFAHGVRLAVNHSGDSDSTGSIAGALLGVQVGEYGLPGAWLAALQEREVIRAVADDLLVGYGGGQAWRTRYPGN